LFDGLFDQLIIIKHHIVRLQKFVETIGTIILEQQYFTQSSSS